MANGHLNGIYEYKINVKYACLISSVLVIMFDVNKTNTNTQFNKGIILRTV